MLHLFLFYALLVIVSYQTKFLKIKSSLVNDFRGSIGMNFCIIAFVIFIIDIVNVEDYLKMDLTQKYFKVIVSVSYEV